MHVVASSGQERKRWMVEGGDKLLSVFKDTFIDCGIYAGMVTTMLEDGDPAHEIIETAELKGADRIIMATHGKTGLKKLAGSVTEKVLRRSKVLVLVVPPNYEV